MKGNAQILVRRAEDGRQIADYYQQSPLRVFLPYNYGSDFLEIVLGNTSGGVVAGDELRVSAETRDEAAAIFTTQAAEKIYRSTGADTRLTVNLIAATESCLTWIPQETILFDGVRLRRRIEIDAERGASILAGEILFFGRAAKGEKLTHGMVHDEWRVRYAGELKWADNLHLAGNVSQQMSSSAGFDGSTAMASLIYVTPDNSANLALARSLLLKAKCRAGVTLIGEVLIARWLGKNPAELKQSYINFVVDFASKVNTQPFYLPQVWRV